MAHVVEAAGVDQSRTHAIDPDAILAQFARKDGRQAVDGELGTGIGRRAGGEQAGTQCRDVDDRAAAPAFDHATGKRLAHVEAAVEVGIDDAAPLLDRQRRDRLPVPTARRTGVIDHEIHPAEFGDYLVSEILDGGCIGDVGNGGQRAAAQRANFIRHRVDVAPSGGLFLLGV